MTVEIVRSRDRVPDSVQFSPEFTDNLSLLSVSDRRFDTRPPMTRAQINQLAAENTVRVRANGSLGTGAVVDAGNGRKAILTDDHVLSSARVGSYVNVDYNGRTYRARVTARDPQHDVAVLELPAGLQDLQGLRMAASGRNQQGERIMTAGHPHGSNNVVITEGVMGREMAAGQLRIIGSPAGADPRRPVEEAQLRVQGGNSGGAVLNERGEFVGLVHAGDGDRVVQLIDARTRRVIGRRQGNHAIITPIELAHRALGIGLSQQPGELPRQPHSAPPSGDGRFLAMGPRPTLPERSQPMMPPEVRFNRGSISFGGFDQGDVLPRRDVAAPMFTGFELDPFGDDPRMRMQMVMMILQHLAATLSNMNNQVEFSDPYGQVRQVRISFRPIRQQTCG